MYYDISNVINDLWHAIDYIGKLLSLEPRIQLHSRNLPIISTNTNLKKRLPND